MKNTQNKVFVLNMYGKPLMPCSNRKARLLLEAGKAKIVQYNPFTIQLNYPTPDKVQECNLGVTLGSKNIGIAVTVDDTVVHQSTVELRQDIPELLQTRRMYRKNRKYRKTRYREKRFLNRKSVNYGNPPSVRSKVQAILKWIDWFTAHVPNCTLYVLALRFNISVLQKKNPAYVEQPSLDAHNERDYIIKRDSQTCQICGKFVGNKGRVHHIQFRSKGGTNSRQNKLTICEDCHTSQAHKKGGILYKKLLEQQSKGMSYKSTSFMNRIYNRIVETYPNACVVFGETAYARRNALNLPETIYNNAIAVTLIDQIKEQPTTVLTIMQRRKKKRSLHEGTARKGRSTKNTTQKRVNKNKLKLGNFCRNDVVKYNNQIGYISGFGTGAAYVKDAHDNYIRTPGKVNKSVTLSKLKLIHHSNNWIFITEPALT